MLDLLLSGLGVFDVLTVVVTLHLPLRLSKSFLEQTDAPRAVLVLLLVFFDQAIQLRKVLAAVWFRALLSRCLSGLVRSLDWISWSWIPLRVLMLALAKCLSLKLA